MSTYTTTRPVVNIESQVLSFVKEAGIWYADLPEFVNAGLGTRSNLMMVDGADSFLDLLCSSQSKITLQISKTPFPESQAKLQKIGLGLNSQLLNLIGHASVDYGSYYQVTEFAGKPLSHRLWLCPVTEYVFGEYPEQIFLSVLHAN
jgi:hypothetical protein